uniref:Uncharacterized protein n=1 Tax=Inkyuleea mariana TaxID=123988 RepID=A0A4D6X040_9FLOR|nr:hypothetical protein [Inkyuleea mariana]
MYNYLNKLYYNTFIFNYRIICLTLKEAIFIHKQIIYKNTKK